MMYFWVVDIFCKRFFLRWLNSFLLLFSRPLCVCSCSLRFVSFFLHGSHAFFFPFIVFDVFVDLAIVVFVHFFY